MAKLASSTDAPAALMRNTRLQQWMLSRLPSETKVTLPQGRIYILPTRAGWFFALAMLVMLLASLNYNLSLGFALTFLLAGSSAVSVYHTHNTLRGLQIACTHTSPNHAGTAATVGVRFHNSGRAPRYAIQLNLRHAPTDSRKKLTGHHTTYYTLSQSHLDLQAQQSIDMTISAVHQRRGALPCPRILLETVYPFGLWRCWAFFSPASQFLFYPAIDPMTPPWQAPTTQSEQGDVPHTTQSKVHPATVEKDVGGVRPYQAGDAPRDFAWRAYARTEQAASKLYDPVANHQNEQAPWQLDFDQLPTQLPLETKLSRLATWITQAEATGRAFSLHLPDQTIPQNAGAAHSVRCLEALARFQLGSAA